MFALLSCLACLKAQDNFINIDTIRTECSLPKNPIRKHADSLSAPQKQTAIYHNHFVESPREAMHSSVIGGGFANVLDTYLSPYNYKGPEIRIMRETMRMTKLWGGRVSNQSLIDLNCSYLDNAAGTAHEWAGGIRYSQSWHYNSDPIGKFYLLGGLSASGYAGVVYNTRNGNNPAQAKVDLCVDLSGMAMYKFRMFNRSAVLRYQLSIPFVGVAFSPNYGQSYYEIFTLGNYDKNAVFAYFGNMPSMRNMLTLDIPLGRTTIRIGYVAQFNQALFNELRYHSYSHNFMIGFVKRFIRK